MGDFLSVVLTVLLLAANAFFVGAEFALISARRDRLETLAEQGKHSAVAVIRAGENLPLMLAGAQLGITVCSILLGRVGEPAVAHLLERPFGLLGIPDTVLHTVSFVIAITIVVVCTCCSARWCRRTSRSQAPSRRRCCWFRRICYGCGRPGPSSRSTTGVRT